MRVGHLSFGKSAGTHPSIRKMMLRAKQAYAAGLISVHNHPSGDRTPSEQDKLLTRDLVIAGRAMDIHVFDHLIIGDGRYSGFADEGLRDHPHKGLNMKSPRGYRRTQNKLEGALV
ncbi:MAG: JAB domain-containing protein [Desulfatiglandales bacterium]